MEFKYKVGQKVFLRDNAQHNYQRQFWRTGKEPPYGIIEKAYVGAQTGRPWYRVHAVSGYGNSYPESDLGPLDMNTNQEAKVLLSKEW